MHLPTSQLTALSQDVEGQCIKIHIRTSVENPKRIQCAFISSLMRHLHSDLVCDTCTQFVSCLNLPNIYVAKNQHPVDVWGGPFGMFRHSDVRLLSEVRSCVCPMGVAAIFARSAVKAGDRCNLHLLSVLLLCLGVPNENGEEATMKISGYFNQGRRHQALLGGGRIHGQPNPPTPKN